MIKTMELIKRKPGLSHEEFVRHYEEVHAPLALKHFPSFKKYVRNHVISLSEDEGPDFDCITEIWFENEAAAGAAVEFWQSDAGKVMRDDEENFMDRDKVVFFLVDEKVSEL